MMKIEGGQMDEAKAIAQMSQIIRGRLLFLMAVHIGLDGVECRQPDLFRCKIMKDSLAGLH
jgi:hypothetical protein